MRLHQVALWIALFAVGGGSVAGAEVVRFGGNSAATGMLPEAFAVFARDDPNRLDVFMGMGHAGAMSLAAEGGLDLAVAGRALNAQELALGLTPVMAFRTPYGLATSHQGAIGFKSSEIANLYRSANPRWADGAPIRIILRQKSDIDTVLLGELFPNMVAAIEEARRRPDVPTAATDMDNVEIAKHAANSVTGATLSQVMLEPGKLRLIPIDGVEPSLENLELGSYPYEKTYFLVLPPKRSAAAERFIEFLRSATGTAALRVSGYIPIAD